MAMQDTAVTDSYNQQLQPKLLTINWFYIIPYIALPKQADNEELAAHSSSTNKIISLGWKWLDKTASESMQIFEKWTHTP